MTSHQAIFSLLFHAAAVDREALIGAHWMTPFAANSAYAAGATAHAPLGTSFESLSPLAGRLWVRLAGKLQYCQESSCNYPAFFVVVVGRETSFGIKPWWCIHSYSSSTILV